MSAEDPTVREVVDVEFEDGDEDVVLGEVERLLCESRWRAGMRGREEVGGRSSEEDKEELLDGSFSSSSAVSSSSSSSSPLG